ncbi:MAG: FAD-binding protein [Halanaerobiaceae bacterium]|nr:FAD-binding protein [Halanaerobiaceae bacterium]
MYDIVIVGGGPAGATLSRLISNKYKVLLLEKRSFQRPLYSGAQKCCGGLLAPDAQKMLASFGLGLPKKVIIGPQLFAVRTIDFDNSLERYYQRHYINIDREEFDLWLESLIPSNVGIINGAVYKGHNILKDYVMVEFIKDGKKHTEECRLIVGADGAFSMVRRCISSGKSFDKTYLAVQEWFESSIDFNFYGAVFDSEITDFYSWIIPKEQCLIIGSALKPGPEAVAKFELLKRRLEAYGFNLEKSIRKNGTYLLRPANISQICPGNDKTGLIGEAAGFISPSSAEGFSYAFRSAAAMAEALNQDIKKYFDLYRKFSRKLYMNITLKRLKSPFMYDKLLRKTVMKSGFMSIDIKG